MHWRIYRAQTLLATLKVWNQLRRLYILLIREFKESMLIHLVTKCEYDKTKSWVDESTVLFSSHASGNQWSTKNSIICLLRVKQHLVSLWLYTLALFDTCLPINQLGFTQRRRLLKSCSPTRNIGINCRLLRRTDNIRKHSRHILLEILPTCVDSASFSRIAVQTLQKSLITAENKCTYQLTGVLCWWE